MLVPTLVPQDRQLVAQYDDLRFLELGRAEQQEDKLQNALERDVKNRQDHGASERSTTGVLFCADRISAPHTSSIRHY
jgi:hypothetical protein